MKHHSTENRQRIYILMCNNQCLFSMLFTPCWTRSARTGASRHSGSSCRGDRLLVLGRQQWQHPGSGALWFRHRGLVASGHVRSPWSRGRAGVLCTRKRILNPWTTRQAPLCSLAQDTVSPRHELPMSTFRKSKVSPLLSRAVVTKDH